MSKTHYLIAALTGLLSLLGVLAWSAAPTARIEQRSNQPITETHTASMSSEAPIAENAATSAKATTHEESVLTEFNSDASPEAPRHPVWLIESNTSRVYLMGSVHVLRESDYPLPDVFQQAYDDADKLVMELGIDEVSNMSNFAYMRRIAMLPDEQSLADYIGTPLYDELAGKLAKQDINLSMFDRVEPWYAAMTITQIMMQRIGYKATHGIEMHFMNQAVADDKPGAGLETAVEQFDMLDGLSQDTQVRFLEAAVLSPEELAADGDKLIRAWRTGNIVMLDEMFADDMDDIPELENTLLTERNERWLPKIEALTEAEDNYLVIVGALHLVGEHGVIELLRQRGFTVTQL